ncbi:MaoC family dehydratase N-terminal domain-containing protein [Nocardioides sp. R-C-SC26]|uniref:FAS1-like dehydratase domain-containing protein n=1 Tax=Nocardioides sp. R-C-SC26 TaxID=2870414 RepID=UPI001E4F042F|nr:MaoC family dehydratase N-terminal domain-containing protein [Nocardioides sp. R-C-SC26]
MPVDPSLVGREFPPSEPFVVTREAVEAFALATGAPGGGEAGTESTRVPATFPIVIAFGAMQAFLDDVGVDLARIVHGEQRFAYERPLAVDDELTATLTVSSLRQIGGNDIIGTVSAITDASGALVCSTSATLVHRGGGS